MPNNKTFINLEDVYTREELIQQYQIKYPYNLTEPICDGDLMFFSFMEAMWAYSYFIENEDYELYKLSGKYFSTALSIWGNNQTEVLMEKQGLWAIFEMASKSLGVTTDQILEAFTETYIETRLAPVPL